MEPNILGKLLFLFLPIFILIAPSFADTFSGIIFADTTYKASLSPFKVVESIEILSRVPLTKEARVEVIYTGIIGSGLRERYVSRGSRTAMRGGGIKFPVLLTTQGKDAFD